MRILLTGASSFTGFWFARELRAAGHEVVMIFRRGLEEYGGTRYLRIRALAEVGECVEHCTFGDERFIALIKERPDWELLAHHAAEVQNYKNPNFDVDSALRANVRNLRMVLELIRDRGCSHFLLTGSIFEPGEGAGSDGVPAFSPYALSKGLTAQVVKYFSHQFGLNIGKFVISNPFGPYEEARFTHYLISKWFDGITPTVKTPAYVRDNIHVTLLAKAYARFADELVKSDCDLKLNPAGYIGSQGDFARRVANEIGDRLGMACPILLKDQREFPEPKIRVNTDYLDHMSLNWNERAAWDELADYYKDCLKK